MHGMSYSPWYITIICHYINYFVTPLVTPTHVTFRVQRFMYDECNQNVSHTKGKVSTAKQTCLGSLLRSRIEHVLHFGNSSFITALSVC